MGAMLGRSQLDFDRTRIDEICQERKLEYRQKAVDLRNSKLEEIERNAYIPPADGSPELPYDIWYEILTKYVTEPEEIKNLWQVSDTFRQILRRKYIQTMLPEIGCQIKGNVRDPIYEGFDWGSLLDARLLSRQCKRSMEASFHAWVWRNHALGNSFDRIWRRTIGTEITEVDEFPEWMIETVGANTFNKDAYFPGRFSFYDSYTDEQDLPELYQAISVLFGLIGHRIRYFSYSPRQMGPRQVYDLIRTFVQQMPNLEFLLINAMYNLDDDLDQNQGEIEPFPCCPSLKCFCEHFAGLSGPLLQRIIEANPTLEVMDLYEEVSIREGVVRAVETLQNLTSLEFSPDLALINNHNLPWKLNRLVLDNPHCHLVTNERPVILKITSGQLFPFLKQFEETLEILEVNMDVINSDSHYLELGNLKSLKWRQHKSFKNVSFLAYAARLESLYIRIDKESKTWWPLNMKDVYRGVVGDKCGCFSGRTIWDVLPYLKRVQIVSANYLGYHEGTQIRTFRGASIVEFRA